MATATQGFALLEDRLREARRSIGLPADGDAPSPVTTTAVRNARTRPSPGAASSRARLGDLVLLGVAWIGLAALVALAF